MANRLLTPAEDLMQELREMEERLSSKQHAMKIAPERSAKRFPRFTISSEMSLSSILGEISSTPFNAESN